MVPPLHPYEEEAIELMITYQERFGSPSQADLETFGVPMNPDLHDENQMLEFMASLTYLSVCLIIEFSKRVPGFETIDTDDKVRLIKLCSSEVMMLRASRRYDFETDSIMFDNGQPYTRENFYTAGVGKMADPLFDFCRKMAFMKVDNAEYALLTAILIFADRLPIDDPNQVETIQEVYLSILHKYMVKHRTNGHEMFPRLVSELTELSSISDLNFDICYNLKVKNKTVPPILSEIWCNPTHLLAHYFNVKEHNI